MTSYNNMYSFLVVYHKTVANVSKIDNSFLKALLGWFWLLQNAHIF